MNHALDVPKSSTTPIHWQMMMAARENSKRYNLWLERGYLRYFGWNMRTAKLRYTAKRHKIRVWTNQQRKENYHD